MVSLSGDVALIKDLNYEIYKLKNENDTFRCKPTQQKTRENTIIELLTYFKFSCPGGEPSPICDICGASPFCIDLRNAKMIMVKS